NDVTDSAIVQTIFEIERMQNELVPAEELNRNVQSSIGGFLMSLADPSITAQRVQSIEFYHLPSDYYDNLVNVYNSTTDKDVMALAKKYLKRDNLSIIVVGKASEVQPKLEQFGTVEVWDSDL